jgi:hypothetical protein
MIITDQYGITYKLTQKSTGANGRSFGWASKIGKRGASKRVAIATQKEDGSWWVRSKTY